MIDMLQNAYLFFGDIAKYANSKDRTRERMASDDGFRDTKRFTNSPDLILKQQAQRLNHLELHIIRQTTNIVMRLNGCRWSTGCRYGFNHIRVNGSLAQPFDIFQKLCFFVKHVNEFSTYDLALFFRIFFTLEGVIKLLFGIYAFYVQCKSAVRIQYRFNLEFAQKDI